MAAPSSILAWRVPWTGKPGGLSSVVSKESDLAEWLTLLCAPCRLAHGKSWRFLWLLPSQHFQHPSVPVPKHPFSQYLLIPVHSLLLPGPMVPASSGLPHSTAFLLFISILFKGIFCTDYNMDWVVPQPIHSYIEVLTPSTSERDYIWRQGL